MSSSSNNSEPISVCHIASGERWAGAEAQVATLVRALARRSDIQVCALLMHEGRLAEEIRDAGVEFAVFDRREHSFVRTYKNAREFLKGRGVQILHSHRYKENLLALMLREPVKARFLIRTQHGNPEPRTLKGRLVYALDRVTGRCVDRVVSVSSQLNDYLLSYLQPSQVETVHNGIDLRSVCSSLNVAEARRRLGIRPDVPVIGIVARLDPIKRHDIFLRTAKEVVSEIPEAVFAIAGGGNQEPALRTLAESIGIAQQVRFLGHQSNAYDILRAMDIHLITSDNEGLPMAVLEAMALGTVVVSRKVGGIPEVINDEVEGVLVDSADPRQLASACVRVLRDGDMRTRLASSARDRVSRCYSAEANAEAIVRLYRTLLTGRSDAATQPEPLVVADGR
ncbi:MAG TPA: glycosyltransferase [Terriglobales bacterium]|nr:glycosyltransferase [Terriglobales bacterium]